MIFRIFLICLFFTGHIKSFAQTYKISGNISEKGSNTPVVGAIIYLENTSFSTTSEQGGSFGISSVKAGEYVLIVEHLSFKKFSTPIKITDEELVVNVLLEEEEYMMDELFIKGEREKALGIFRLKDVEGTSIYAGKKSEVVKINELTTNVSTNNTRQIFARVAGLNIWESDGAGIQLGIGGRGLNPNRVSNFNTRQNGYDISADALGYPESYYTPPAEALERVEIVRGASSLQYGTQFGGFVNFRLKKGPADKKIEVTHRLTGGSFNFLNTFNSVGGTIGKVNYYSFYQYKKGDGWRPNSAFDVHTAHASATLQATSALKITAEYTFMNYLAQQAGGLTDREFRLDPRQSKRERNWFKVNWNLAAVIAEYQFNHRLKADTRFFGLLANKSSLGFLGPIHRPDPMTERDLLVDDFKNWGNETRLVYDYRLLGLESTWLVGTRYYSGYTHRRQGLGNAGSDAQFDYVNSGEVEFSNFEFPNQNISFFTENIFRVNSNLKLVPGIRYEKIVTNARGFYNQINRNFADEVILNRRIEEDKTSPRSFLLFGIGGSYKLSLFQELYANISQNYRSINFNDIRVQNPNLRVDENLKDETGYTFDIGTRGNIGGIFAYDVTGFYIQYKDRIGSVLRADTLTYNTFRYRTNVSDSRNIGVETYFETNVWRLIKGESAISKIAVFSNASYIDARYMGSEETAFQNKKVEYAPNVILKAGLLFQRKQFSASYQYSYTSSQFTDATNAIETANAVNGEIPSYYIMDLTLSYVYKQASVQASVNNLTNNMYFTRRADGYPGPGIIPSDGRSFYLTLQIRY